jgi:hypothetical protein
VPRCLQVRQLKYDGGRNLELDNILLIGAQTGLFIYSTFTIIGGHFTIEKNTVLVLITALASLLQTTSQTMFVLDASRRSCVTPDQIRRKPGRELVTFLLVTNLAMWAINTLEKSRAESHPIQLHFYGLWAWTIITHVSMPLAIFYRYSSTLSLTSVLNGGGWSRPRPGRLPPGKRPGTHFTGGCVCCRTGAENLAPTGIRSPDCPACSDSLYRLSYRGQPIFYGYSLHRTTWLER